MGQQVDGKPGGIQDSLGVSAASKVTANTRVKTSAGTIGILTDIPSFTGTTATGLWTLGAMRCRINGIPAVHASAVGIGIASATPPGTTGPIRVAITDPKVAVL